MTQLMKKTVIVGMSGGIDSSVSALLLKEQGYHVIGLFMKNWEEKDSQGICNSARDYDDVRRVCDQIQIPYYGVNFVKEYWDQVFSLFLEDIQKGLTPNPDILCNREIKFKVFLEKAKELGADFLATGHYCQNIGFNEKRILIKGVDANKDQTYFLYTLNQQILSQVIFPIGHLRKSEVRAIGRQHHLTTSEKKDSTGICFIGKRDFSSFLSGYIGAQPGLFMTLEGKKVGEHAGAAYFTIGQRRGLGIGGAGEPWFVAAKNMETKTVIVVQGENHPALFKTSLIAHSMSWIGEQPYFFPYFCKAKIRYRQADQPCLIEKMEGNLLYISFPEPQRAITPGQSIVFYQDNCCLGGAIIRE